MEFSYPYYKCYVTPSAPWYVNLFKPFQYLYDLWSTSGSDRGIALFFTLQEYNLGSGGKKKNKRTKRTICLGLTQVQKESYAILCMCRLTLVWILAKLLLSYWNADSSWLSLLSLVLDSLMPTGLSAPVSTGHSCHPSPTANFELLCPILFSRPLTTSGHAEISSPKPFVWFRAKTNKGIVCLADHLHSVT